MKKLRFSLVYTLIILITGCSFSGTPEGDTGTGIRLIDSIAGTPNTPFTLSIRSGVLNENRRIYIQLPEGYAYCNTRYPVLFVMDGEWLFHLANANQRYYSYDEVTDQNMPRMIVVGIENTDRDRDYTPTSNSGKEYSFPSAGGADKFLDFLESELIPMLDHRYRTAPHRCIAGWSFSGLFAAYAGFTRPELFNMYLCISPAVWWDDDLIYKKMETVTFKHPGNFVFTLGSGEEGGWVYTSTTRLLEGLSKNPVPNMTVSHIIIEGTGHTWGVSSAMNMGLQSLYKEFVPASGVPVNNPEDLEAYYKGLSEKWGYKITPPGKVFINLAWNLWANGEKDQAEKVLRSAITANPEDSPSLFNLGQLLYLQGELSEGLKYFQQAFDAEKRKSVPNGVNLDFYKVTIEKTEKKLAGEGMEKSETDE